MLIDGQSRPAPGPKYEVAIGVTPDGKAIVLQILAAERAVSVGVQISMADARGLANVIRQVTERVTIVEPAGQIRWFDPTKEERKADNGKGSNEKD